VDEHAKASLAPPLHASVTLGGSFGVLDSGDWMVDGCCVGFGALKLGVGEAGSGEECERGGVADEFHE